MVNQTNKCFYGGNIRITMNQNDLRVWHVRFALEARAAAARPRGVGELLREGLELPKVEVITELR